jgi:hypothetical protein
MTNIMYGMEEIRRGGWIEDIRWEDEDEQVWRADLVDGIWYTISEYTGEGARAGEKHLTLHGHKVNNPDSAIYKWVIRLPSDAEVLSVNPI